MSQIDRLPEPSAFGKEYNYEAWTGKNSVVTLHTVPWNADYRDVVAFANVAAVNEYLDSRPMVRRMDDFSYHRYGESVRTSTPFNEAIRYNYLRVQNPTQPIAGDRVKTYYYFITDVRYVAPETTEIFIQLDVWTTFSRGVTFGNAWVEQGHVGVAELQGTGQQVLAQRHLSTPEGLDLGSDYQVVDRVSHKLASANSNTIADDYYVMIVSTTDLETNPGTVDKPNLKTAKGLTFENLPSGANIYFFDLIGKFQEFLGANSDKPWMLQGIISVTVVPRHGLFGAQTVTLAGGTKALKPDTRSLADTVFRVKGFRDKIMSKLPARYQHLRKFATSPYTFIELTSYSGQPVMLRPELVDSVDMEVRIKYHYMPPSPRIAYVPWNYNKRGVPGDSSNHDGGDFLDVAGFITNFPQYPVVTNGYLSVMASSAHSTAHAYQTADWSQQKALAGNSLSYDQSSANISLANQMNQIQMGAAQQRTNLANEMAGYSAIKTGIGAGVAGGLMGGGAAGAAMGMIGAGADFMANTHQNNQSLAISNSAARSSNAAQTANAGYMRDTNKSYADYAARGDYQNQIAGLNAKTQDAKLTQPGVNGQVGGDSFLLAKYQWGVDYLVKMPPRHAVEAIGEYWLRYGYSVHRPINKLPSRLQVMSIFSYWKLKETYITGAECPEPMKQAIRGILEKGVTVWHDPEKIGSVDPADNVPITANYLTQVGW